MQSDDRGTESPLPVGLSFRSCLKSHPLQPFFAFCPPILDVVEPVFDGIEIGYRRYEDDAIDEIEHPHVPATVMKLLPIPGDPDHLIDAVGNGDERKESRGVQQIGRNKQTNGKERTRDQETDTPDRGRLPESHGNGSFAHCPVSFDIG